METTPSTMPSRKVSGAAGSDQGGGGIHKDDIALGTALPGEDGVGDFKIPREVAALEIFGGSAVGMAKSEGSRVRASTFPSRTSQT